MFSKRIFSSGELWVLALNKYQRDNLLQLLNCIGYGAPAIEPFHTMNTGDWVGELALMLSKPVGQYGEKETYTIDKDDRPNACRETVQTNIEFWLKSKRQSEEPK